MHFYHPNPNEYRMLVHEQPNSLCSTHGKGYDKFIIPAGGSRQPRTETTSNPVKDENGNVRIKENIHMDGFGVLTFINS